MKELKKLKSRCGAKTRSGKPCAKYPMTGKRRCRNHGGASTGPKSEEGRQRISSAQLKHGRFVNWREKRRREKYHSEKIRKVINAARDAGLL